ncbi:MAG: XkdX family protein [Coriobacteriia bacterium]|nr:XkdX family protein [Coriobacteriia bacterium]
MWQKSQSDNRPALIEKTESCTFIRKNLVQGENGWNYLEYKIKAEDWGVVEGVLIKMQADLDYLLAKDEDFIAEVKGNDKNWSETIEKYKFYYENGLWDLDRVNKLLERGAITQEEYNYIVGENK